MDINGFPEFWVVFVDDVVFDHDPYPKLVRFVGDFQRDEIHFADSQADSVKNQRFVGAFFVCRNIDFRLQERGYFPPIYFWRVIDQ